MTAGLCAGIGVVAGAAGIGAMTPPPALAAPIAPVTSADVTSDALPTVQIDNGVVWSQVVVGNTVYAGGNFANARPAGAVAGTNLTPRGNLLSYDITTGNLISSFAPTLNGQVNVLAASPDGSVVYVGGAFTQAGTIGGPMSGRGRIAAYSTATGQLLASFAPSVNATVYAIAATASAVYVGGVFSLANGVGRARVAAFSAATGALLGWAPTVDNYTVKAMVMSPDGTHLIIGGSFESVNGTAVRGLVSVSAANGSLLPFAVESWVKNSGTTGSIMALATDGHSIFGTSYVSVSPSNYEGVFSADVNTGALNWLADCHGDGYGVFPSTDAVYVVSHEHDCSNIGGFPNNSPPRTWYRTTAFTKQATGVDGWDSTVGYAPFTGQPTPSLIDWFPILQAGTFTGQSQAAWTVAGNAKYVVEGGEFPVVNDARQYGLVRFAVSSLAPNRRGPQVPGPSGDPVITPLSSTAAQLAWPTNWDPDDANLVYSVFRADRGTTTPIFQRSVTSEFWNQPTTGYLDTGLSPGATYTYFVRTSDPAGNAVRSDSVSVTMPTNRPALVSGYYSTQVQNDGATNFWRLDQPTGTTVSYDRISGGNLALLSGVTAGAPGATADSDAASRFNGTTAAYGHTSVPSMSLGTFSEEAWFSTTSASTADLLSFGNAASGTSSRLDHYLGLVGGKVVVKLYGGAFAATTLTSPRTYNDGAFHYIAATYSPTTGLRLYVDGLAVASTTAIVGVANYRGYWRVGGDANAYFNGIIDDAAVYPIALTATQVAGHFQAARQQGTTSPTASFTVSSNNLTVSVDASGSTASPDTISRYTWDWGDGTADTTVTTPMATHAYAAAGTYTIALTVQASGGGTGTTARTVTAGAMNQPPVATIDAPSCSGLSCSFDGTRSSDPDGEIVSYAWRFGDGSTGVGSLLHHTYPAAGTYQVALTVADNDSATATAMMSVTVARPVVYASDGFTRSVTSGWGAAEVGGPWTTSGDAARYSVDSGTATMTLSTPGAGPMSVLNDVAAVDQVVTINSSINRAATGSGVTIVMMARRTGSGSYWLKLRYLPNGVIHLALSRVVGTAEKVLLEVAVAGLTYTPGVTLTLQFTVVGTTLTGSVWKAGGPEPASPQLRVVDSTFAGPGALAIQSYLAPDATTAPVVAGFGSFSAISPAAG